MRITRGTPWRLGWRVIVVWFGAIVTVVFGLMVTTKVRKVLRVRKADDGFPITAPVPIDIGTGNQATTFTYGADLFDDMLAAINGASNRILFETYIWKHDAVGKHFKEALIRAAARGVDVYVIYDGFANLVVPQKFLSMPEPIQSLRYPVFNLGMLLPSIRRFGRDHRKILVVDEGVGYVGGYNIGTDYRTKWRDTHIKIEGPAVWDLDNAFVDFWNQRQPVTQHIKEAGKPSWESHIRAHRNVPRQMIFPIRGMYLEAIDRAQHHIYITAAYFIPDGDILAALKAACTRGVSVQIVMPEVSNHVVADWLSRGFYSELLDAGVKILLYKDWMVHAKTATIDGKWSTIGTANIDRLSLTGNYEINLEILDDAVAKHMETIFETDRTNTEELLAEDWHARNFVARACELILRPLRPLL